MPSALYLSLRPVTVGSGRAASGAFGPQPVLKPRAKVYIIEPNSAQLVLIVPKWTTRAPPMLYLCISIREETGAQHDYSQF